jgi:gliding motility-associated-like protein
MKSVARIVFILTGLFFLKTGQAIAQVPNITYQTPQIYNVNNPVVPLFPVNTGGPVPANTYGLVSTVAGSGAPGKINAKGLAATFLTPVGVICDPAGNIYVSEYGNNDIRKIDLTGAVTTYAGNGNAGNTNGLAAQASFDSPYQMAIDGAGNLYVADLSNNLIREISKAGIVSIFAGSGTNGRMNGPVATAQFSNPIGLAFDPSGNMFVADRESSTLRKISASGQVSTFSVQDNGGAPQTDGTGLDFLTTDAAGNIFFTNYNQLEMSTPAVVINVVAGSTTAGYADGVGGAARFAALVGIAMDDGDDAYLADDANNRIRRVGSNGTVTTVAGTIFAGASNGVGATASFQAPNGVARDPTKNYLYVADAGNNSIRKVAITGYSIDKSLPTGLVFDPLTGTISGTPVFTTPPETYTITAYNSSGSSSFPVVISIVDDQTVSFPALPAKTVCDVDFYAAATINPPITGNVSISYTSNNPAVATIVAGAIHITGAGTSIITASDGQSTATQTLTVTAAVTPAVTITPSAPDTCQDKAVLFTAQITGGGSTPILQWQINGQNAGANSANFTADDLSNGDKITCVLTSDATCTTASTAMSNTAIFTLDPEISTSVSITSSETGLVCAETPITFTATAYSPNVSPDYQWQVNGANAGADAPTFTTSILKDGDAVTCVVTSTGKCLIDAQTTSNAITVEFNPVNQCVISIPNTFTPNGDGINDLWDITALTVHPGCTIAIYTRSGTLIYNSINYPKPWDGTYNGKKLPVGTYYYVIDLKNGKQPLAGPVTILR